MIHNVVKPQLLHRRNILVVSLLLGLSAGAFAQDGVSVRRAADQQVCVFKPGVSGTTIQGYILVPTGTPGQFRTVASPQLRVGEETSCFEVAPDLDLAIAAASGTSFLFIPTLTVGDDSLMDLMLPIPRHVVLDYPEDHTIASNVIPLTKVYVPTSEESDLGNKANWKAIVAGQERDIANVADAGGVVTVTLKDPPGNGRKAKLVYKEKQRSEFSITVATVGVPKGTKEDPIGNSDVFLGFTFARSKLSEKTPQDSYGLKLHAGFVHRLPARGNSLLSLNPSLDLLANAPNQADDENAGLIALPLVWQYLPSATSNQPPPFWAERFVLQGGPSFESTKDFRITNFIYSAHFHVIPQIWAHKINNNGLFTSVRFDLDPQAGYEGGSNIHNPVASINRQRIGRFKTRGFAKLTFLTKKTAPLAAVVLQADYIYRYLFQSELVPSPTTIDFGAGQLFPSDGSGPLPFPGASVEASGIKRFDTGPRRYVDLSLRFIVNRNWEFFTSFTRGELPPAYKHVDKLQTGVAFRFKIGNE